MGNKINYRIQLASNFQVVEFNLELDDENEMLTADDERIIDAVNCVNKLGERVVNTIKTKNEPTKMVAEKMASEKQIELMKKLKIKNPESYTMEEAQQLIKDKINCSKNSTNNFVYRENC